MTAGIAMALFSERDLVPCNIRDLKPYVAGKTIAEVRQEYDPTRIAKLASNENRLGCSPHVEEAVQKALQEIQDYPDPISENIRQQLAEKNNVKPENIIVGAGSESLIANLCRTFFLNHEQAVTADATFVGFFVQANIRGISLIRVPVTNNYSFDLEAISSAVSERTKMVYIANPNNPTGTYISKTEFENFMNKVPSDVLVVMDEAYYEYAHHLSDYPSSIEYDYPNVLTLRTFSKAYGLAGFRIGYAIAAEELINQMMKTKLTFEPTTLAQAAAEAALQDDEFIQKSLSVVENGKEQLYRFFDQHGVKYVKSSSNSVMMVLPDEEQAVTFNQEMLKKGVILRRVGAFGLPNCIRITIGTEEDMAYFRECFKDCYPSKNY